MPAWGAGASVCSCSSLAKASPTYTSTALEAHESWRLLPSWGMQSPSCPKTWVKLPVVEEHPPGYTVWATKVTIGEAATVVTEAAAAAAAAATTAVVLTIFFAQLGGLNLNLKGEEDCCFKEQGCHGKLQASCWFEFKSCGESSRSLSG